MGDKRWILEKFHKICYPQSSTNSICNLICYRGSGYNCLKHEVRLRKDSFSNYNRYRIGFLGHSENVWLGTRSLVLTVFVHTRVWLLYTLVHISRIIIAQMICLIIRSCVMYTWFWNRLQFLTCMCNVCIMYFFQSLEITTLTCVGLHKTYMALVVFWPHMIYQDKMLRCLDQTRPEERPRVLKTDVCTRVCITLCFYAWYEMIAMQAYVLLIIR